MSGAATNSLPKFVPSLESVRGIAAILVVVYHMYWFSPVYGLAFIRNGALMVDVFFVLSGFVIFHVYMNRLNSESDFTEFVWLRFWRVYPLHLTMLFVFVFIGLLKLAYSAYAGGSLGEAPFEKNNLESFFLHLTLLHSMGFQSEGTFNAPSWSISVEFFTYLLAASVLITFPSAKAKIVAATTISIVSLVIIIATGHDSLTFDYNWSFFRCSYGFFLGATVSLTLHNIRNILSYSRGIKYSMYIALVGLTYILSYKYDDWREFLVPPLMAIIVLGLVVDARSAISIILEAPFLQWLGKISYSIYMIHMAVLWAISVLLQVVFDFSYLPVSSGEELLNTSALQGTLLIALTLVTVVGMSELTYRYIEKPFRDWGRVAIKRFRTSRVQP